MMRRWLEPLRQSLRDRPRLKLFLQCLLIVVCIFPDVVFKNASISMFDQINFAGEDRAVHTLHSERHNLQPYQGFFDVSGAALQSEPAIQFLKHSLLHWQSPYWNPYSGAGAYGPETMVDLKFSPITTATALIGGSNQAFHFITLLFYTFALFFLSRTLMEYFGFSLRNALVTCVIFLLNGYFTANISSNTSQVYIYFPLILYAVVSLAARPGVGPYLLTVIAYALALSVTFFPSTVLTVACACGIAAGASFYFRPGWKRGVKMVIVQASAVGVAALMMSFIYLPLAEAMKYVAAMDLYSQRNFYTASFKGILSFFSGKHVFEHHNAMHQYYASVVGNEIFHFGLIAGFATATILFSRRWFKNTFLLAAVLLMLAALGRIFGVPGISQFVDALPFFRNVAEQYFWVMVACTFPLVFAHGFHEFESSKFSMVPTYIISAVAVIDLIYILTVWGFVKEESAQYLTRQDAIQNIVTILLFMAGSVWLLHKIRSSPERRKMLINALAVLIVLEMGYYFQTARFSRTEKFFNPPDYIAFLKENLGLHRVAAYGSNGFPAELGTAYQLQQIEFFTMNIFPSYYALCQRDLTSEHGWYGKDTFCINRDTKNEPNVNPETLNLLSVKYLVVSRNMPQFISRFESLKYPKRFESPVVIVFENPGAFPRVYAAKYLYQAAQTPSTQKQSAKQVAFTEDQKLLEDARSKGIATVLPTSAEDTSNPDFEAPKITKFENAKVDIDVTMTEPGVVILPDNWHPNWKATDNGQPIYIGKVNETFRGIALTAGTHHVEMKYQPATLPLALTITGVVMLLMIVAFLFRRRIDCRLQLASAAAAQ